MHVEIDHGPSYAVAVVALERGETIVAESGAMVAMDTHLSATPGFHGGGGGLLSTLAAAVFALVRRFVAGETIFVNAFQARSQAGRVLLAPAMVGDIVHVPLAKGAAVTVQAGSWLAASKGVRLSLQWGGLSALFARESPFFVRCSGPGEVLISSYGGIDAVDVDGEWVVDSGHLVAWQGNLTWTLRKAGGWIGSITSGEGLVLAFKGKGRVWMQTRNTRALIEWITPMLPG
jgi:uncharacterized protein (TIGR00266 family)